MYPILKQISKIHQRRYIFYKLFAILGRMKITITKINELKIPELQYQNIFSLEIIYEI